MLVQDIMRPHVLTVRPEDSLATAAQMMAWSGARHLPVVAEGRVVGLLSERDLLRHRPYADGHAFENRVAAAMQADVKYVAPDAPLIEAADRMAAHKVGCLPVISGAKLVGILTTTDLLLSQVQSAFGRAPNAGGDRTAGSLMTANPTTANPDEFLAQVVARMTLAGTRHLPVVDGEGKLLGIISDRDLGLHAEDLKGPTPRFRNDRLRASDVMQRDVRTVRRDATFATLVALLADWRMSAVPVVEDGDRLVGIVSYVDVLRGIST